MTLIGLRDDSVSVRVAVPAKINLALAVGDLRSDGYHDLATVFHAVDLHDEVTVRPAARWSVRTPGFSDVPGGLKNLAGQAAKALHALLTSRGSRPTPVAIEIEKKIPVAGGLAGGSADAAAALVACNALWGAELTRDELHEVAAGIGSDVPFALHGGTAVGAGRGELLSPVLTRMTLTWVLALADSGLSTPAVFDEFDRLREIAATSGGSSRSATGADPDSVVAALRTGDVDDVAAALGNDLEPAAVSLNPALRRTVRAGAEAGALATLVSGSGPTVALLCRDPDHAADTASRMAGSGTCRTVRIASGPVPGARIVGRGH